jgi:hypothetical protein
VMLLLYTGTVTSRDDWTGAWAVTTKHLRAPIMQLA